ncbi:MAG TPA: DUF748 domain-containing protein [Holophagaceae bacterium]|nr:DUF748 domain-containing protein [Holophagaceae bacterium]
MVIVDSLRTFCRRFRWPLRVLGGLYALYALFGFLILPGILQRKLVAGLSTALKREVRLSKVKVNPLALSVTLEGLEIRARKGTPWVSCARIYANAELWPLLTRTAELKDLELDRPKVILVLDEQGRPEFADLLAAPAAGTAAKAEPEGRPWTLALDRFQLLEGAVDFSDASPQEDFKSRLGPLSFSLRDFRTSVGARSGGRFEARTESGEELSWEGSLVAEPLSSQGTLKVTRLLIPKYAPYLHESVSLDVKSGRLDLTVPYTFTATPEPSLRLTGGGGSVTDLAVAERGGAQALKLPGLSVENLTGDLLKPELIIGRIALTGADLTVSRRADGTLNWNRLLALPPGVKPKPKDPKAKPLALTVKELALVKAALRWEDAMTVRPVALAMTEVDLTLKDLNLDPQGSAGLTFAAKLGETGRLGFQGTVKPLAAAVDLQADVDGIALPPVDPYLAPATDLRFNQGRVGLKGRLRADFGGKKTDGITYAGDVWVDQLEAADGRDHEVALRWKRLALKGLDASTAPLAVKLKTLDWLAPEGRVVIAADGTTNVNRAFKIQPEAPPSPAAAVVQPTPKVEGAPIPLTITLMKVAQGRLSFIDRSLSPNAALLLSDLEGTYDQLSSAPGARSQVLFTGKAGGVGPLRIEGKAYPLRTDEDTDVRMSLQGAELTDLDPYSRKYLGYVLQKGKLGANLRLHIQKRKLSAVAQAKLDQLYLGDKVESKDATWIPVKLALALLRDRHGVIDMEVPIDGSLDDPDIHWGGVAWKALLNILGKAATSPFSMLGNLFGGGADLSSVAFAPGESALPADAAKVTQGLVKSLQERPALSLELEGAADPIADGAALKRRALEDRVRAKAWVLAGKAGVVDAAFAPGPAAREAALRALHDQAFPPPPRDPKAPKVPEAPLAEVESRLLGSQPEDPEGLRALAEARADVVQKALLDAGAPGDRVFPVKGTLKPEQTKAGKVWFAVK